MKTNLIVLKTLRGDILQFLYAVSPTKAKESSITSAYFEYYEYKDILRAIYYLADKHYIRRIDLPSPTNPTKTEAFYEITAEGMSIIDHTETDKGITVEEDKQ